MCKTCNNKCSNKMPKSMKKNAMKKKKPPMKKGAGKGLVGKQGKLDKNKNGKLDSRDFKMLRASKKKNKKSKSK